MQARCRFADLIPDQQLMLSALPDGEKKTYALESAYEGGLRGCFLTSDSDRLKSMAYWYRDEFRAESNGNATFDLIYDSLPDRLPNADGSDTNEGYIASKDTFEAWQRDRKPGLEDWLFKFYQNSGNCVGASGVEGIVGLIGARAMDPRFNEVLRLLIAMWQYAFRGYCGGGWTMGAHASMTRRYGYMFADIFEDIPGFGRLDFDGEQDSEDYTVRTWCRNQPDSIIQFVKDRGWFFEEGAISEFSGGVDALKRMVQNKGMLHHGSNRTSGSSTPDRTKSIGGHAQAMFGGDWSDRTIDFYKQVGVSDASRDNFPCVNHQTWGGGWGGEVADKYWCPWWGPKPQGAWVVLAQTQLRYFSDGYVYLPLLKGIPSPTPPPTPGPDVSKWPPIGGEIYAEHLASGIIAIRGIPLAKIAGHADGEYEYLLEPIPGTNRYRFVPKIV